MIGVVFIINLLLAVKSCWSLWLRCSSSLLVWSSCDGDVVDDDELDEELEDNVGDADDSVLTVDDELVIWLFAIRLLVSDWLGATLELSVNDDDDTWAKLDMFSHVSMFDAITTIDFFRCTLEGTFKSPCCCWTCKLISIFSCDKFEELFVSCVELIVKGDCVAIAAVGVIREEDELDDVVAVANAVLSEFNAVDVPVVKSTSLDVIRRFFSNAFCDISSRSTRSCNSFIRFFDLTSFFFLNKNKNN